MKQIKDTCYKGTQILVGNRKRDLINEMIKITRDNGFDEIIIPIIQYQEIFSGKVGKENNNMMYGFTDRGNRNLCLAPEYTAVIQQLAKTHYNRRRDVKLFYIQECFRGEKPQSGRYRQFTQFGVEILNPTKDYSAFLQETAKSMISVVTDNYEINTDVTRGLDYYVAGKGFEIACPELGSSKQVCGGGQYDGGIGFAIGVDRLLLVN